MKVSLLTVIAILSSLTQPVAGAICYYLGPNNGTWHDAGNWSNGYVPGGPSDDVRVFDDRTVRISSDVGQQSNTVQRVALGHYKEGRIVQESGTAWMNAILVGSVNSGHHYAGEYVLNGGTLDVNQLRVGRSHASNTFVQQGGILEANVLEIGEGPESTGFVTQFGGIANADEIRFGRRDAPSNTAIYMLEAGELTCRYTSGPQFEVGDNIYLDIRGGALNLLDIWDFERLSRITNSDFRAFGETATANNLMFNWVVIDKTLYTQITAVPEPSSFTLFAASILAFVVFRRRRPRC